jgi:TonB-linked SusC/RagA family outer membrane protein
MKQILSVFILFLPLFSMCQPVTIHGKVLNEEGEPVVNATITIKSSNRSTITNEKGEFTIHDSYLTDTIMVSAKGYETTGEPNNIRGEILIVLRRSFKTLGEVIINTGYTSLPKERATGSFEKIDNEMLKRRVSPDWLNRLEGISGVYFDRRGTTAPGAITIRGRSTIYANAVPLIVLDNFPYDGDINNINPNDIESITILKDAAAASIWGVRAGNGVIVITTKKGKQSKTPSLELNTSVTIGAKPDLFYSREFLNSSDFIDVELLLFKNGFYNGAISNTSSRPPLSPVEELLARRRSGLISAADSASQIDAWRNIDVRNDLDRFLYRNSLAQQYALNYSGGSQHITWLFSAGFDKINSNLAGNNNNRYTFLSRTSYRPFDAFEFKMDIGYTHAVFQNNNPGIITALGKNLYPYARLADDYGNPLVTVKDYRLGYVDTAGAGKLLDWKYRALEELSLSDNTLQQSDIRWNFSATYNINKYFTAVLLYQYEKQTRDGKNLHVQDTYFARDLINRYYNPLASNKYAVPLGGILDLSNSSLVSQNGRAQLNYGQSWNTLHEVYAIAGAEIRQSQSSSYNFRTYGYSDDVLTYNNVNYRDNLPSYGNLRFSQPIPNPTLFSQGVLRFVSLYTNAAYTYFKKYTLSASARKDASNLFGVNSNQKWVPLWSSGISWNVHNEKFYKSNFIPYLKLRLTYGYSGNLDNTLSAYTTIRYTSSATFTNAQYAMPVNPPNPELRWEKIAVLNLGIDFTLKNDRISGSIDMYRKKGKDLIGFAPVDPTTGVRNSNLLEFSYKGNVADMKANGIELSLNSKNFTGAFKWTTTLLYNHVTSKVTKYNISSLNASAFLNAGIIVNPIPGKPLYSMYSFAWAGLDPATGDPQGYLNGAVSKDYNALANVTVDKLTYHGSAVPVTFGSLLNSFEWRHISLSVNLVYKLGYYFRRSSVSYSSLFENWAGHADYAHRWQKPGDEKLTDVPSLIYPNSNPNRDFFYLEAPLLVERGDHIRLQDISLSYDIAGINKKWPVKNIRVYTYISNIGILWKENKSGLDPDYFGGGYPLPLTFSIGLKSNF